MAVLDLYLRCLSIEPNKRPTAADCGVLVYAVRTFALQPLCALHAAAFRQRQVI